MPLCVGTGGSLGGVRGGASGLVGRGPGLWVVVGGRGAGRGCQPSGEAWWGAWCWGFGWVVYGGVRRPGAWGPRAGARPAGGAAVLRASRPPRGAGGRVAAAGWSGSPRRVARGGGRALAGGVAAGDGVACLGPFSFP